MDDKYKTKGDVTAIIDELEKSIEDISKRKRRATKGSYDMGRLTGEQDGLHKAVDRLKEFAAGLPDIRADHDL